MSSVIHTIEPISEQAYLDGEKLSEIKHEYKIFMNQFSFDFYRPLAPE